MGAQASIEEAIPALVDQAGKLCIPKHADHVSQIIDTAVFNYASRPRQYYGLDEYIEPVVVDWPGHEEEETNPREGETRTPREGEKKPPEGENPFAREERQPQRGRKEKVQLSKDSIGRLRMIRT